MVYIDKKGFLIIEIIRQINIFIKKTLAHDEFRLHLLIRIIVLNMGNEYFF